MIIILFVLEANQSVDWPAIVQAGAAVFAALGLIWNLNLQRKYTRAQIKSTNLLETSTNSQNTSLQNQILINNRQTDLIEQQMKLNEIAINKHIRDIRPIFYLENLNKTLDGQFNLVLQGGIPKSLIYEDYISGKKDNQTGAWPNLYKRKLYISLDTIEKEVTQDYLKITFEDEEQRAYVQKVYQKGKNVAISFPALKDTV
jgi:hypothetical protein